MSASEEFRVTCIALGGIFPELLNITSLYIKSGLFIFESGRLKDFQRPLDIILIL